MAARTFEGRLRRAIDGIWNRGDLDLADALLAADYTNHGGLIPDVVRGPEAVKIAAVVARLAFPGLRVTVEGLVGDGEHVAVRWTARAAPAARPIAGVTFGRIAGDRISESWTYWEGADEPGRREVAPAHMLLEGVGRPLKRRAPLHRAGGLANGAGRATSAPRSGKL
jgi:hypothetical protein